MRRRAVFLDRDGVLTRSILRGGKPYAPTSLAEFEILSEAPDAVRRLKAAGFATVVVTNQPDLATGKQQRPVLEVMHERLSAAMPLDLILVCDHTEGQGCACRKPKPGMLIEAAGRLGLDLANSIMVGDRWRDIDAGRAAGCRTILIDYDLAENRDCRPDRRVRSIAEAGTVILAEELFHA